MAIPLKYNTASQEIPLGHFVDSTDGNTEETGLTIANTDIKLWKAGATTLANKNSGGATHIANGVYYAVLDGTDTGTLGPLVVFVHVSGALAVRVECVVLPAVVFDSLVAGSDYLQTDAVQIEGTDATDQLDAHDGNPPTAAAIRSEIDSNSTQLAAIVADTNELQTDLTNGGRLDLLIDAIKAKTDNLPASPAAVGSQMDLVNAPNATAVTAIQNGLATQASVDTIDDFIDTEVAAILADTNELQTDLTNGGRLDLLIDAIKAKTDNLPASPAAVGSQMDLVNAPNATAVTAIQNGLATQASVDTIDDFIDTEVAAILADTNELQTDLTNGGRLDLLIDAIKAKTDNLPASPAAVGSQMDLVNAPNATAVTAIQNGLATQASVDTVDGIVDAILVDTGTTLDALIKDVPTNAELAAALAGADDATLAAIAALENLSSAGAQAAAAAALTAYDPPTKAEVDALLTTAMTESYAADGAAATPAQMLYMIWAMLAEKSVSGVTLTAKKLDGSTSAMTFTLDDATDPTAITRAS